MTKEIRVRITLAVLCGVLICSLFGSAKDGLGSQIDPVDTWAWSSNAGWINLDADCDGFELVFISSSCQRITVYSDHLEGYAWGENIGWIRFGSHTGGGTHTYGNASADDYGVNRDSAGNLSGYAWGTNVGWIKFDPEHGGVTIDPGTGSFDGYAWSENVGWIDFGHLFRVHLPLVVRDS